MTPHNKWKTIRHKSEIPGRESPQAEARASRCSLCGCERIPLNREKTKFGACTFIECKDPTYDYYRERGDPEGGEKAQFDLTKSAKDLSGLLKAGKALFGEPASPPATAGEPPRCTCEPYCAEQCSFHHAGCPYSAGDKSLTCDTGVPPRKHVFSKQSGCCLLCDAPEPSSPPATAGEPMDWADRAANLIFSRIHLGSEPEPSFTIRKVTVDAWAELIRKEWHATFGTKDIRPKSSVPAGTAREFYVEWSQGPPIGKLSRAGNLDILTFEFAEAFAAQKVREAEQDLKTERQDSREWEKMYQEAKAEVAELLQERDTSEKLRDHVVKTLQKQRDDEREARECAESALASAIEAKNAMQIDCQTAQHQADEWHKKWTEAESALGEAREALKKTLTCGLNSDVRALVVAALGLQKG